MSDFEETIDLLLLLQEQVQLTDLDSMARTVLAIKQLAQVQNDLRIKLRTTKAHLNLEETVALSKLIKDAGTFSETMQPKRYTSTKVSWDRDIH